MHEKLKSLKNLSDYLLVKEDVLRYILDNKFKVVNNFHGYELDEIKNVNLIVTFNLKKKYKSSKSRTIHRPYSMSLISILHRLEIKLNQLYTPGSFVHGFIRGKNIKTNALPHLGKEYLLNLDIKDFYDSINYKMIFEKLVELGFNSKIADYICNLVLVNDALPQGFQTSPLISNLVFEKIDAEIEKKFPKLTYTRYADDLSFSSDKFFCKNEIITLIENFGFEVNKTKIKFNKRGQTQIVTGLTIYDNKLPRIPKRIKRSLRLEIHYLVKNGLRYHIMKNNSFDRKDSNFKKKLGAHESFYLDLLYGRLIFYKSIEPDFIDKCFETLRRKKP